MLPLVRLGGEVIYTYALFMGISWAVALNFSKYLITKKRVTFKNFELYFFGALISSWVGAKLLFLLTLDSSYSINEMAINSNFWMGGGFVFYGGLIFGALFTWLYKSTLKLPWENFTIIIPPLLLAHGIGRLGCFMAGCCFGKTCPIDGIFLYPVQLLEAFGLFLIAYWLYKRLLENKPVIWEYFFSYSILRFFLEFLRGDEIRGVTSSGLSTSQVISLLVVLILVAQRKLL